ncbi:MAG: urease accessory protein UreE [Bryobacterales bacterium]
MTAEDRARVRRKVIAPDGRELALALPTGTRLWPGQVIHCEADRVYVIEASPELVTIIHPRDVHEAAAAGHLVGNMHRDIDLEGDGITVLYDEILEERLRRAGLTVERAERPFHGNAGGGHSH